MDVETFNMQELVDPCGGWSMSEHQVDDERCVAD